jgi:hypothetical protein
LGHARLRGHDVFLAMHWCLTYETDI